MDETTLNWSDLQLFLAIARHGGLAPATGPTGKSAPTLGRRMLALERHLGQDLFHRLPSGYSLTEQGAALLDRVAAMEGAIGPVQPATAGSVMPRVKISAGSWMTRLLCGHAHRLRGQHAIAIQFVAADHRLDIEHREVVIGIRNSRPVERYLACQRSVDIQFAEFAHHDVQNGSDADWIHVLTNTPSARWVRDRASRQPMIEVSHPRNALDCALAGVGKTVLPVFVGQRHERLVQVSEPIAELEHQQWVVMHHEDRHLVHVRTVIDNLVELLRSELG